VWRGVAASWRDWETRGVVLEVEVSGSAWSSALFISKMVVALRVMEDVSLRQRIASVLDDV